MRPNDVITLDLARLEKVRRTGGKITFRCPGCAAHGSDRTGNHGVLFLDTAKFTCTVERTHSAEIWRTAGIRQDRPRDLGREREGWKNRELEARTARKREAVADAVLHGRPFIEEQFRWDPADVWEDSPCRLEGDAADDPRGFLASLFPPDAIIWTGHVTQSGDLHAERWRTVGEWQSAALDEIGPMVAPAVWRTGTTRRAAPNVVSAPYVVLDFDGDPAKPPQSPEEVSRHRAASLATIQWLRQGLHWNLAAILDTGSKSLHAWKSCHRNASRRFPPSRHR